MDTSFILIVLSLGTMIAVVVFALISKNRTEKRLANDNAPKSTLAADTPDK